MTKQEAAARRERIEAAIKRGDEPSQIMARFNLTQRAWTAILRARRDAAKRTP